MDTSTDSRASTLNPLAGGDPIGREAEALHPAAQIAADALGSPKGRPGIPVHLSRDLWRAAYTDHDSGGLLPVQWREVTIHAPQELSSAQTEEASEAIAREAPRYRVKPYTGHGFTCWVLRPLPPLWSPKPILPLWRVDRGDGDVAWTSDSESAEYKAGRAPEGDAGVQVFHTTEEVDLFLGDDPRALDRAALRFYGFDAPEPRVSE